MTDIDRRADLRTVRSLRGAWLTSPRRLAEGPCRMLHDHLDPDVAERREALACIAEQGLDHRASEPGAA